MQRLIRQYSPVWVCHLFRRNQGIQGQKGHNLHELTNISLQNAKSDFGRYHENRQRLLLAAEPKSTNREFLTV